MQWNKNSTVEIIVPTCLLVECVNSKTTSKWRETGKPRKPLNSEETKIFYKMNRIVHTIINE